MLRRFSLPLIVALTLILTSCTSPAAKPTQADRLAAPPATPTATSTVAPEATGAIPPASCPITRSPSPLFTPPSPYPPTPPPLYAGQFWFGTPMLWTMLDGNGTWQHLPHTNGLYVQKTFWWRQGYDPQTDPQPQLQVTGRRLDAPASPLTFSGATNGSRGDIGSFMIVGIDIPTAGCWEIAGQIAGTELRYVVWLAP